MEQFGTGAGLAALGFWLFIGLAVASGAWNSMRKRESQHETLRRIIESGQPVDEDLANKLLSGTTESKSLAQRLEGRRPGHRLHRPRPGNHGLDYVDCPGTRVIHGFARCCTLNAVHQRRTPDCRPHG